MGPLWLEEIYDAAWREGKTSFSGLVRNNKGELLKVWVEQGDTLLVTVAECIAVEVAIQVAIEEGYEQVIVEGDSKSVIDTINNGGKSVGWELYLSILILLEL